MWVCLRVWLVGHIVELLSLFDFALSTIYILLWLFIFFLHGHNLFVCSMPVFFLESFHAMLSRINAFLHFICVFVFGSFIAHSCHFVYFLFVALFSFRFSNSVRSLWATINKWILTNKQTSQMNNDKKKTKPKNSLMSAL